MVGLKEICVLLLAGGVGAGSVVTVQTVRETRQAASKPKAARPAARPASRPAARAAADRPAPPRPALEDCPTQVASLGSGMLPDVATSLPQGPLFEPAQPGPSSLGAGLLAPPGGGSGGIVLPPPPEGPVVPEPAAWAMMVSGFGLVGVALRIGRRPPPPALTEPVRHA